MRPSLRVKAALALFVAAIALLAAQAIGVRTLAEAQEERLINAIIEDDMHNLLQSYRDEPDSLPPMDPAMGARVSQEGGQWIDLPPSLATLPEGVHELMLDGREVHVAVARFGSDRIYRTYDYSAFEKHFKDGMNALLLGSAVFVLPTIWLAYWLSGLLVRQIGGLARQVRALRSGAASMIDPARYDEHEVAELAHAVNDYHVRMAAMVAREKQFTANVSHELRTPLTRIRTSCELLEPTAASLDAKSRQRLRQIEQAAEDMHALVECLLALAREETATVAASARLADIVESIVERHAERLERQAVRAVVTVPGELRIQANVPALGIVLSNLVDNALRHTQGGEIRFTWREGSLTIEDTGSGIAAEALPHVFERFYRAPGGSGGFGIGLAIVKEICDRYGWDIGVDSIEGQGTRVRLGLDAR
ncbi:sensor histidine kinase [Massilia norwichensis]|uniref:histidine kinase n=1 Tax=Massilia norwichensis TaxID=1442366 RepID=A0ABT2A8S8_9BURK|nr:HAMP domain-containing sensor histidine kinase [Massilia norwichensis]MCS0590205.1 HAMP domain-containing histidine kinase [Massilia norwichensis]